MIMQSNISNRTIFCRDNLDILKGINSGSIDLIYIDPPFNKKKVFTASTGSSAEGASFKDYFREEDVKKDWLDSIREDNEKLHSFLGSVKDIEGRSSYNFCYLCYMAIRIIEMYRVLRDTGSFYLHCDPTMSHYLKILLDIIFGEKNFRNEIVWHYHTSGNTKNWYVKNSDTIFFYAKSDNSYFNLPKVKRYTKSKSRKEGKHNLGHGKKEFFKNEKGIYQYVNLDNVWQIPYINSQSKERTGYPTQKPIALLERIIKASSNKGDVVLDAFCGCCTTMVASEKLMRQWIGIDVSVKAFELVKTRLKRELEEENEFFQTLHKQKDLGITFTTTAPKRTDINNEDTGLLKKYFYVISHPEQKGWYKVGIANNVKQRLNSYQTGDKDRTFRLEYSKSMINFRECEKYIHSKYENMLEWVKGDLQLIIKDIESFTM